MKSLEQNYRLHIFQLMLLMMAQHAVAASSTEATEQQFLVTDGLCSFEEGSVASSEARSSVSCAAECARTNQCLACHKNLSLPHTGWKLLRNASGSLKPGNCKLIAKLNAKPENCATNSTLEATFLVLNATDSAKNMSELRCFHWCRQLALDTSLFAPLDNLQHGVAARCQPLSASDYFANIAAAAATAETFSPIAVSVRWRRRFVAETWCAFAPAHNVPPLLRLAWSQPLLLDVCAQACASRPTCEFFVFNDSGCFEGSLSLYLNSRLQGVQGCSMWHKSRSWASSMLAFYTFNSSTLNLANPGVMPAVNNSPIDIGPDGVQIPVSIAQFVRLNLSHIGFDSLVRANTPFTFLVSFVRSTLKSRFELAMFASCSDSYQHNGAIGEQSSMNQGWFLNSLTGKWQVANSESIGSSYNYPSGSTIHLAMALGPTSGYFVVNGVKLGTTFYTAASTYGTDPAEIGCLYLGYNWSDFPNKFLYGRIKVLGIFKAMLTAEEINELV